MATGKNGHATRNALRRPRAGSCGSGAARAKLSFKHVSFHRVKCGELSPGTPEPTPTPEPVHKPPSCVRTSLPSARRPRWLSQVLRHACGNVSPSTGAGAPASAVPATASPLWRMGAATNKPQCHTPMPSGVVRAVRVAATVAGLDAAACSLAPQAALSVATRRRRATFTPRVIVALGETKWTAQLRLTDVDGIEEGGERRSAISPSSAARRALGGEKLRRMVLQGVAMCAMSEEVARLATHVTEAHRSADACAPIPPPLPALTRHNRSRSVHSTFAAGYGVSTLIC